MSYTVKSNRGLYECEYIEGVRDSIRWMIEFGAKDISVKYKDE